METYFPPKTLRIFDVHAELGSPFNPATAAVITLSGQVLGKPVNAACVHNIDGAWGFQVTSWQSAGDDRCLRSFGLSTFISQAGLGTAWSRGYIVL
jgi:hypothetical protein